MLRPVLTLLLLFFNTPAGAAIVRYAQPEQRIIHLWLDASEKGLFETGDFIRGHTRFGGVFKGMVKRLTYGGEMIIKLGRRSLIPFANTTVTLVPTYKNDENTRRLSYRRRSGANAFGERLLVAMEAGNGEQMSLIYMGGKMRYYMNQLYSLDLSYTTSFMEIDEGPIAAEGQMAYLRLNRRWRYGLSYFGGLAYSSMTAATTAKVANNTADVSQDANTPTTQALKLRNSLDSGLVEGGVFSSYQFRTTTVGNVSVLGIDWLVLQYRAITSESHDYKKNLEDAYPLKSRFLFYHRIFFGLSF